MENYFFTPLAVIVLFGVTVFTLLLWYSSRKQTYWKERGIPFVKPLPFLGSALETMRTSQHELDQKRYSEFGTIWGFFEGNQPVIAVADPKLLRDILVKDFHLFSNRRKFVASDNVIDSMVPNLEGNDWKRVRTIITPTFSSGKLKKMLGIFQNCSQTMVQNIQKASNNNQLIDVKKVYGALSMDIIASSAFSTKLDSHNDPENTFVRMAKKIFGEITWRFILYFLFPGLMKLFKISVFNKRAIHFFRSTVEQIIDERNKLGRRGNDFLQLLMDTANEVEKEKRWEDVDRDNDLADNYGEEIASQKLYLNSVTKSLSTEEVVAQCVIFFIAGYDPASTTLAFATYSLALNPVVQEKARKEIRECLKETNGELTYETLQKMKYLDNIISETLRLYPPGSSTERRAETDYELGDTGITIPRGMIINIPICALHGDPKYYPDPEKFNPDRFLPEECAKRNPYVYLPFGAGPRNCIGMRFALLEIKVCLVNVINQFDIKTCSKTTIPLRFIPGIFLQCQDIFLKMEPRKDSFSFK